jgi:methyl-accepting chemotaxis protein
VRQQLERKVTAWNWVWGIIVALLVAWIAVITFVSFPAVSKQFKQQAKTVESLRSADGEHLAVARGAVVRADSALNAGSALKTRLIALNASMHELASRQYAIEVRADRLDSAVTTVAAGLEELDQSVQQDFNFVADRIDSTLVVANAAGEKADEAQQSMVQLRGGFDALRTNLNRRVDSMRWQNRLAVGLGVVNGAMIGVHIIPDSHHK